MIALAGGDALAACLGRLGASQGDCQVMLGDGMGRADTWQARFPAVRFVEAQAMTVPMRRQRGIEAAQGALVALLEDTSLPEPGWREALCEAFASEKVAAAGGPVRIDPALPARTQALACTEYGRFHPDRFPQLALGAADDRGVQAVSRLPGNNLAYRRATIVPMLESGTQGLLESVVNEKLRASGHSLALHPRMAVVYSAADPQGIRVRTRWHHGRLYAGQRAAGWGLMARLVALAGSVLLPVVLSARSLAAMTRAVRPAAWLPTAFWICVMETAWAAGEGAGYVAGGGDSVEAWR